MVATSAQTQASTHIPMRPTAFAVLAALSDAPRPGIEILDHVNTTLPGQRLLGPGTLYRLMRELRRAGLIVRTLPRDKRDATDERQAYHELTRLGRYVLVAESRRLRRTLALVKGWTRLAPP
jgi:DNA-binding PadR family transcriptional regulator